jgi:hypothetical protein
VRRSSHLGQRHRVIPNTSIRQENQGLEVCETSTKSAPQPQAQSQRQIALEFPSETQMATGHLTSYLLTRTRAKRRSKEAWPLTQLRWVMLYPSPNVLSTFITPDWATTSGSESFCDSGFYWAVAASTSLLSSNPGMNSSSSG